MLSLVPRSMLSFVLRSMLSFVLRSMLPFVLDVFLTVADGDCLVSWGVSGIVPDSSVRHCNCLGVLLTRAGALFGMCGCGHLTCEQVQGTSSIGTSSSPPPPHPRYYTGQLILLRPADLERIYREMADYRWNVLALINVQWGASRPSD